MPQGIEKFNEITINDKDFLELYLFLFYIYWHLLQCYSKYDTFTGFPCTDLAEIDPWKAAKDRSEK